MEHTYQLLQVKVGEEQTVVVLPWTVMGDRALNQQLHEDFLLVVESATQPLVLDLRAVEYCSGMFVSQVIELHFALASRKIPYTMLVSSPLRETFGILRIDQLLRIDDGSGILSCDRAQVARKAVALKGLPGETPQCLPPVLYRWFAWLRPGVK